MALHLNLMTAQAQARVRLVFFFSNWNCNGNGVSFGLELPKHPFHYNDSLTGIRRRRRRRRSSLEQVEQSPNKLLLRRRSCLSSASSRIHSSSSSLNNTNNKKQTSDYSSDDDDDDDEFREMDDLACFRGLVLDVSYRPINVVCWKRAICLEFMEKADVLEYYDQTVNSATGSFYIPAVLRVPHLLQVVKRRRINANLSRKNILHRDAYTCQYCSSRGDLTIDHVIPAARGGDWKWENLVTACAKCNSKKGHKTLEEANMKLSKVPKAPKDYDILAIPLTTAAIKMLSMRQGTPEEWRQYLS